MNVKKCSREHSLHVLFSQHFFCAFAHDCYIIKQNLQMHPFLIHCFAYLAISTSIGTREDTKLYIKMPSTKLLSFKLNLKLLRFDRNCYQLHHLNGSIYFYGDIESLSFPCSTIQLEFVRYYVLERNYQKHCLQFEIKITDD